MLLSQTLQCSNEEQEIDPGVIVIYTIMQSEKGVWICEKSEVEFVKLQRKDDCNRFDEQLGLDKIKKRVNY